MRIVKIAILGVAALAGIGAIALVQSELDSAKREAELAAQRAAKPVAPKPVVKTYTEVLVAAKNLERGQALQAKDLKWEKWPKAGVNELFIRKDGAPKAMETLGGALVRQYITKGEPILQAKLIKAGSKGVMSALLREGMRAVAIKVAPETGAGGFILPGDFVDVILTREAKVSGPETGGKSKKFLFSDTLLQNIRVLAIDTAFNKNKNDPSIAPKRTATLEVTPQMAELLPLVERAGKLALALRSFADTTTEDGQLPFPQIAVDLNNIGPLRIGRLTLEALPVLPKTIVPKTPVEPVVTPPQPQQILIIRGATQSNVPVQ